jgi:hypothetical protein
VVVDPETRQLHVLNAGDPGRRAEPIRVAWDVAGMPVAALPMRLTGAALNSLVVLRAGGASPVAVVLSEPARTFYVTDPRDGVGGLERCETPHAWPCTLRGAIEKAGDGLTAIYFDNRMEIWTAGYITSATLLVDGTKNWSFGEPGIKVRTAAVGAFTLGGARSTVRGLWILDNRYGVKLKGAGGHVIEGNVIARNDAFGVVVNAGSNGNTIGG